jgi:transposase
MIDIKQLLNEVKEEPQKKIGDFLPETSIDWSKYNQAKCKEKRLFYALLNELCSLVPEPAHVQGRKPFPLRDLLFCSCLKVYHNFSARRISSDLAHAKQAGYIQKHPHFNTLLSFLNNKFTYDLLQYFITISAMPLSCLEEDFAMDSSGFGSYQYERWQRVRFQKTLGSKSATRGWRNYVKAHISVGTRTHVVSAMEVTQGNLSDSKQLPYLVKQTSRNFNALRYSADKAYSSRKNMQLINSLNALPFIPFKTNSTGKSKGCLIWNAMFQYFDNNREKFDKYYHRRSNVESVFSMVKTKYGEFLKSKNFESQRNEVLIKFLVHNIACLVEQIFENNIDIDFSLCAEKYIAHK